MQLRAGIHAREATNECRDAARTAEARASPPAAWARRPRPPPSLWQPRGSPPKWMTCVFESMA